MPIVMRIFVLGVVFLRRLSIRFLLGLGQFFLSANGASFFLRQRKAWPRGGFGFFEAAMQPLYIEKNETILFKKLYFLYKVFVYILFVYFNPF